MVTRRADGHTASFPIAFPILVSKVNEAMRSLIDSDLRAWIGKRERFRRFQFRLPVREALVVLRYGRHGHYIRDRSGW